MRFALLGLDPDALELARAVVRSGEHSLVWAGELGELAPLVESFAPALRVVEGWEGLLAGTAADAVIVARASDEELRADQLRKLVQERIPLLVSHPVVQSMLVCYELEMIRAGGGVLLPYVPGLGHPAIARLHELLRRDGGTVESALGRIEHLAIERRLTDRSRPNVLRHFVRDLELVAPLCERLTKVGAMVPTAAAPAATDLANVSVQMSGLAGTLVRWSVAPPDDRPAAAFTWVGSRGKATLAVADSDAEWKLDVRVDGQSRSECFPAWDAPAWALSEFCAAVEGRPPVLDWIGACRTMELADAIDHSLERGRTIELHYEEPSEQSTFKGMMSGLGCFLLIGGLVLLIAATTAVNLGIPLADYWPYLLLALLGSFLLLQLLRLAMPGEAQQ